MYIQQLSCFSSWCNDRLADTRTQQALFEAIDHSAIPFQHLVAEMRRQAAWKIQSLHITLGLLPAPNGKSIDFQF